MERQNWNHDVMEHILSLTRFLQEHGVSMDRPEEVLAQLPETPELRTAYEMLCFMEEIPGGFMIYQASGDEQIVYANRGLMRMLLCDTWEQFQQVTGGSFRGLVHPEEVQEVEESIARQISGSQYDLDYVEYRIIRRDGSIGWVEDYGHFVRSASVGDFFYVFLGDATEKRDQQRELEQKQILTEALESANLAMEAKNEFLSNMSHDMHTPLNAILGFTALAKLNSQSPGLVMEYVQQVEESARQLLDLIDKVLEMTWLGSNKLTMKEAECDLCQIVREVCGVLSDKAAEKELSFTLDCAKVVHTCVLGDREKLRKLTAYLVSNAVSYTKPGGRVSVTVTEEREPSGGRGVYKLAVADTGVGIGAEFLEHIYEPFARERNSTISGVSGMGLGLTIAKHIVDRMGGSIDIQSRPGEGSTFTVTLRLRPMAETEPTADAQSRPGQLLDQRILLVEDNEINREMETEILRNKGFFVDTAENGEIAVEKVKNSLPEGYDLILMDIQMPVMDGWQAAQEIRRLEDPLLAAIPIIALSANTLVRDMRRSMESGMDAHLTKPIDIPRLLGEIGRTVRRHEQKNS